MNKLFFFLATVTAIAQVPAGYYNAATGSGLTLKTQLATIIANSHTDQGYNAFDAFTASNDLDVYSNYENDNSILDIYSERPTTADPYNYTPITDECGNYNAEGICYNKEHVIPQSVFTQQLPMRSDAHSLLPTDGRVNGFRSNYPFGEVGSNLVSQNGISNPTLNGSKLGNATMSGYNGTVFEPIDEFKGDIARIYFYFVTRYESQVSNWSSYDMFNGTAGVALADPFLDMLFDWHTNDPVSQKEIDRNNAIYNYQGNRNPFVDFPNYVAEVWFPALSVPSNGLESVKLYPNPAQNNLHFLFKDEISNVTIFNAQGQKVLNQHLDTNEGSLNVSNLNSGIYFVQFSALNEFYNQSFIKQ